MNINMENNQKKTHNEKQWMDNDNGKRNDRE